MLEHGRCTGVVTDDGERYLARKAVVSTIHVKSLVDMAPAEAWGEDFLYGIDTYDPGISILAQYYATTEAPAARRARRHPDGRLRRSSSAGPRTSSRRAATSARGSCCTRAGC